MRVHYTHIPQCIQTCDMNRGSVFDPGYMRVSPVLCFHLCAFQLYLAHYFVDPKPQHTLYFFSFFNFFYLSLLRVYTCVPCSISILFFYMYSRIPSSPGVPSIQALPGYLITVPPSVCISTVLDALTVWIQKKQKTELLQFWWVRMCLV